MQYAKKFFANRVGGESFLNNKQVYKFEKIKRAKRAALAKFPSRPLIDMGVGEPDGMACHSTIDTLVQEASKYENRGYADNGCLEFKESVARYMQQQLQLTFAPDTEILHSIGIKSALSLLPYCFVNPGDVILMTVPGYPIFGTHAKYLMGDVIGVPLLEKNNYLPDLDSIPEEGWKKTKVFVVNYPNNPTGACATKEFFHRLVELAHRYEFLIINDGAYIDLTFNQEDKVSIFHVSGAKDVALELYSMSKGFNMTGWRIGWVCGNQYLISAYGNVKDQSDSGQFLAIQKAAAQTLSSDLFFPANNANKYCRRMEKIIMILRDCGFTISMPKAGFFLYSRIPSEVAWNGKRVQFLLAEEFAEWMIKDLGIVVVPWDDAEPSIRWSMTFAASNVDENMVIELFRERMTSVMFKFNHRK